MPHIELSSVPFISRSKEIEEATYRLDQMLAGLPVPDCVLFYYGVPSVGKTTLLNEIRRNATERGVPTALVDFDRERGINGRRTDNMYEGVNGQVNVVASLMHELARTADRVPGQPISTDSALSPDEAVTTLFEFTRDLYHFNQKRPFALFFDTIEESKQDIFLWVQDRILEPLLNDFPILIVMASRTQPNMIVRDLIYPLERRTNKYYLQPFDREQTNEQLVALGIEDIVLPSADLTRFTGGLPGLNERAAHWLIEKVEIDQLLSRLVYDIIFERLPRSVPDDIRDKILAISVLRQFDSGLLKKLMGVLWSEKSDEAPTMRSVRELLKQLQETRFVEPHPDGYGYVVPHDLRLVLDAYWQKVQPQKHFRVHKIAANWFADQVSQGDYVAIADRLYHLGGLWRDINDLDLRDQFIESDLQPHPSAPQRLARELHETLNILQKDNPPPRVFDLTNKIKNDLLQREFTTIFSPEIIENLIQICNEFNHRLS